MMQFFKHNIMILGSHSRYLCTDLNFASYDSQIGFIYNYYIQNKKIIDMKRKV